MSRTGNSGIQSCVPVGGGSSVWDGLSGKRHDLFPGLCSADGFSTAEPSCLDSLAPPAARGPQVCMFLCKIKSRGSRI